MTASNNRLLIVDDNTSIHDDFRKILASAPDDRVLASAEAVLFGAEPAAGPAFDLTMASQGEEAVGLARAAIAGGRPFALAFVDIRMPPGIDGVETARRLWEIDPDLSIVICSAYSDYSWSDMAARLGAPERWILLKKPFENIEVLQMAAALAQKRALQQLARAREADLAALVAERTAKLSRALEQLEQSAAAQARADEERRKLERTLEQSQRLESLGVLAGGIAHDFNNILTGIVGRAALARLGGSEAEIEAHLKEIEQCGRRAAELCEQMLAYAGKGRIAVRDVDLNQLVREIDGLVHASVPRDVEFQIDLTPASPGVKGDPTRLRQVVMNLVINGAEALGARPRRLRLATAMASFTAAEIAAMTFAGDAAPGWFVVIEVTDSGSGMKPEIVPRIFEPFFTTKFDGRGLGLCAVLGIVRAHGGALDVLTAPGRGSTFRVALPAIPPAPMDAPVTPIARAGGGAHPDARGRVLVVDDEECVRTVAMFALRRNGYLVETACDGVEAVEAVRRDPQAFDCVVMDMTMPRMGGAEALRQMRIARPNLPAVLVSGYGQKESLAAFANSAHTVALEKPFDIEKLCRTVASVQRPVAGA